MYTSTNIIYLLHHNWFKFFPLIIILIFSFSFSGKNFKDMWCGSNCNILRSILLMPATLTPLKIYITIHSFTNCKAFGLFVVFYMQQLRIQKPHIQLFLDISLTAPAKL